jgi:hypothetical protein
MNGPTECPANRTIREIDGKQEVYYDGYWIRWYEPPEDILSEKMALIDSLTRRAFHHTESGINTPGEKLDLARSSYEEAENPECKRVNGAMLAGALFNRATDIFTSVVALEEKGVQVSQQNELMRICGDCLREALELGRLVRHHSGEDGVDELWGEPFKAFTLPMKAFFESRYIKVAQTFRDIDQIVDDLSAIYSASPDLGGLVQLFNDLARAGKLEAETMRSDCVTFRVWPEYVAAKQAIENYRPASMDSADGEMLRNLEDGLRLAHRGKEIIDYIVGIRVPMPGTTKDFLLKAETYKQTGSLDSEFSSTGNS